jgi:hypothetical protein
VGDLASNYLRLTAQEYEIINTRLPAAFRAAYDAAPELIPSVHPAEDGIYKELRWAAGFDDPLDKRTGPEGWRGFDNSMLTTTCDRETIAHAALTSAVAERSLAETTLEQLKEPYIATVLQDESASAEDRFEAAAFVLGSILPTVRAPTEEEGRALLRELADPVTGPARHAKLFATLQSRIREVDPMLADACEKRSGGAASVTTPFVEKLMRSLSIGQGGGAQQ